MRASLPAVLLHAALVSSLLGAPRITFDRVLPAQHDLRGAEDLALVHAIGDHPKIESFVDHFVHQINRSGVLRVYDRRGSKPMAADATLVVRNFSCELMDGAGEGGAYDVDGKRVKRKQLWSDARCVARIDVDARGERTSFYAKGEGTSPRVAELTDEERGISAEQAARYAALDAAERITPRRVRESIVLEEKAPDFDEGFALIELDRGAEARTEWERALRQHPRSAALHYNLGALCEALGDRKAAERYYVSARAIAPQEKRYATELRQFRRRNPSP